MLDSILSNPWPAAGTIALACSGAYLAHRNNRLSRFSAAASEFRGAFAAELAALKNPTVPITNVPEFLTAAYPRHSQAVENFRHHLPLLRRQLFELSWHRYHSGHRFDADKFRIKKQDQLFLEYFALDTDVQAITLAVERIQHLISFAAKT